MRAVSVPERMDLGPGPWVLLAGVAVVGAQALLLAPVLPDVARTLDTGPAAIGRALGAYGAATAVAAFTVGRALDRLPRRATLRAAAALMASGLLVCAAAPNAVVLAAGQAVAGLAAGVTLPATYASAGEIAPVGAETRVMGRVLLGWSVAMVAGVPAAAALGDLIGWRGVFVVLAALAAAMVGLYRVLPAGIPSREGSRAGVPAGAEAARRATMRAAPRVRYRDALARPGGPGAAAGLPGLHGRLLRHLRLRRRPGADGARRWRRDRRADRDGVRPGVRGGGYGRPPHRPPRPRAPAGARGGRPRRLLRAAARRHRPPAGAAGARARLGVRQPRPGSACSSRCSPSPAATRAAP